MNERKENMIIEEKDLFGYVFFPENLSIEKRQYIEADNSFEEFVEFYKQLKINADRKLSIEIKKKLAQKIPAYQLSDVIILKSLASPPFKVLNGDKLAAGTKQLSPQTSTKTFVDEGKDYLIKVLNYGDTTKVFVFSTKDEIVKNFDIIIEPQNLTYHFEDNSEPLIINNSVDAEKIQLKLN